MDGYLWWEEQNGTWLSSHRHFVLLLSLQSFAALGPLTSALWWGLSALSQILWRHKRWTGEVISCGNRKHVLSWPEYRKVICRPISCYFGTFFLIETMVSLSWGFPEWPWARARSFCSPATYDQTQVSEMVFVPSKIFKSGFQSSCLDCFFFFRFSSWSFFFCIIYLTVGSFWCATFVVLSLFSIPSFLSRQ